MFFKARPGNWLGFFACLVAFFAPTADASECYPSNSSETVKVRWVSDGDTVTLSDGRKVRLLGINAPEIASKKTPGEPFSQRARRALFQLIKESKSTVRLAFEDERKDRHGRLLAHILTRNETNAGAILVKQGLAAYVAVGANTRQARCLKKLELSAREQKLGIWAQNTMTVNASDVRPDSRGFHIVSGTLKSVEKLKRLYKLDIGGLHLIIFNRDAQSIDIATLKANVGKNIEARGWLSQYRGQPQIKITSQHAIYFP